MVAAAERTVHPNVDAAQILLGFGAKSELQKIAKIRRKRRLADGKQSNEDDTKTQHSEPKTALKFFR